MVVLFEGMLPDGMPITIWTEGSNPEEEMAYVKIGQGEYEDIREIPPDLLMPLGQVLLMSGAKKVALEEGNISELEEIDHDIKDYKDFVKDCLNEE